MTCARLLTVALLLLAALAGCSSLPRSPERVTALDTRAEAAYQAGLRQHHEGRHAQAVTYFERALAMHASVDDRAGTARALASLGRARLALGEHVEVSHLGRGEEHRRGVLAGGHAGSAADAGRGVEGALGLGAADGDGVGLGRGAGVHRHVATRFDEAVEGAAVDHEVLDDGEGGSPPRLDDDDGAIVEAPHVQLTGRDPFVGPVSDPVDVETTLPADPLAAVVIERDHPLTLRR